MMWSIGKFWLEYERHTFGGSFGRLDAHEYGWLDPIAAPLRPASVSLDHE